MEGSSLPTSVSRVCSQDRRPQQLCSPGFFLFLAVPVSEVALTGVLVGRCIGPELWGLSVRSGMDCVPSGVLPSVYVIYCLHFAFKMLVFPNTDGSPCHQGAGSQLSLII